MPRQDRRAPPLPPDERRAAILAATVPLVRRHGLAVSTRQIADAAGVAEGTLFRAFGDKRSLVDAAVETALDPEPGVRRLVAIDSGASLENRLTEAVEVLLRGMESTWQLFAALRATQTGDSGRHQVHAWRSWQPFTAALVALFEPDRERLAVPPEKAAQVLGAMLMTSLNQFRPGMEHQEPFTTEEMVDVIMHGIAGERSPRVDDAHGSCRC